MGDASRDQNRVTTLLGVNDITGLPQPILVNSSGEVLVSTTGGGSGDVVGPASSTDNAIVRFDGITGKLLQDSAVLIDDTNNVTGMTTLTLTNTGLHLLDTNASHDLILIPGSDLTADRNFTIVTGDAARTLTLANDFATSGNFSLTLTTTGATNVTLPTSGTLVNSAVTTLSSLVSIGTVTTGTWSATTIALNKGGTGVTSLSALSIWVANSANTLAEVTPGAGNSIRINGAGNAWEAFTPSSAVPTTITVANEATDTTCFPLFATAATGDLGPKSNASLTFNSNTGALAATTFNGLTVTSTTGTFTLTNAKTLAVTNTLTLSGTDSTVMTFPTTSATIARTDAGNTFTGVSTGSAWVLTSPTITTKLNPTTDDGAPLGDTTHNWSDLFLASGAVINYANGNVVLTHTSGILTMGTGELRIASANVGTNADSVPSLSSTSTLTNKTLTTPVINGLPTGTGVASAATASTLASRDANALLTALAMIQGFTTTATAAATTTMTIASNPLQAWTGSSTQTIKLPTTSVPAGMQFWFINQSSGAITIQSSGANTIVIMAANTSAMFTALQATPTTAAHWGSQYFADIVTSGKSLSVSNTLTLAGTDATTMTFPTTSATIARTDAANTFTGVQSMTSPDITTSLTTPSSTFSLVNTTATTVNFAGAATTMAVGASTALITVAGNIIHSSSALTATANAATVPITHRLTTVTNSSAATLTITITTTSAVDGQLLMVRILDFSAATQTITWVNTENSTVSAPTTSNGSTTLPLTVGFQYNNATSKWRCIASA